MSSSDDEPPVEDEAAAPPPNGESLSAQQLSAHPVWAASRGDAQRSSGPPPFSKKQKNRAPSEAGDAAAAPKFERISLVELEAKQHADADGADSCIDSEDEEWTRVKSATPKRKRTAPSGPREELDDDDDQSSEDDSENKRKKLAGFLGAAAFGGGGSNVHYGASDAASEQSATSTQRRKDAMKDAFPVRGVSCVGCALSSRIGPVNRFVKDYISSMTEEALWKMSALCYRREVAEPAEREGAPVPPWSWKDVRSHYELHATGNFVARHKMIRSLQSARLQAEQRLVRVDNGEKELDRGNADLLLKIVAAESRERVLLEAETKRK